MSHRSVYESIIGPYNPSNPLVSCADGYNRVVGSNLSATEYDDLRTVLHEKVTEDQPNLSLADEERVDTIIDIEVMYEEGMLSGPMRNSTLYSWPMFQWLMENCGEQTGGTALMIGCVSPLSVKAFNLLSHDVYGADHAVVLDLRIGELTGKAGAALESDALALPFPDRSLDYVHTDHLLRNLKDNRQSRSSLERFVKISQEIGRVVKPGGQVFMKEKFPEWNESLSDSGKAKALEYLRQGLIRFLFQPYGFATYEFYDAYAPADNRFWHDPNRDVNQALMTRVDSLAIYGRKDSLPASPAPNLSDV